MDDLPTNATDVATPDPHAAAARAAARHDISAMFIGFTHALRAAGLAIGPDRTQAFLDASTRLDAGSRSHVYWAGRATLCAGPDDTVVYDKTFDHWFSEHSNHTGTTRPAPRTVTQADLGNGDTSGEDDETGEDHLVAVLASAEESLRHRDIASLTASERQRLARLFASLPVRLPRRRGVRRRPARWGDIDAAKTVRDQLRHAGEPGRLHYRRPTTRPRRVVFLLDISGSMEPYADSLLRLAHRVVSAAPRTTEVFTLGTKLTRVTVPLRLHDVEKALLLAGETIPDWSGGTRLGLGLREFLNQWGQRGLARAAVVVIASDGWELGDPALLAEQMQRLHRLARLVLWSNPHSGKAGYAPVQGGIVAALPWLDGLVAGHSVAAFTELLELIANA
ncbi:MAG: VWA domain-containing protein [Microbacteriaceae bacterium]|nr:MAG: VWA domain-containing protein [Microbacteriaceae bacterium]